LEGRLLGRDGAHTHDEDGTHMISTICATPRLADNNKLIRHTDFEIHEIGSIPGDERTLNPLWRDGQLRKRVDT
jgi:hypothetical protein